MRPDSPIRFASDPEWPPLVLWEPIQKSQKELYKVPAPSCSRLHVGLKPEISNPYLISLHRPGGHPEQIMGTLMVTQR